MKGARATTVSLWAVAALTACAGQQSVDNRTERPEAPQPTLWATYQVELVSGSGGQGLIMTPGQIEQFALAAQQPLADAFGAQGFKLEKDPEHARKLDRSPALRSSNKLMFLSGVWTDPDTSSYRFDGAPRSANRHVAKVLGEAQGEGGVDYFASITVFIDEARRALKRAPLIRVSFRVVDKQGEVVFASRTEGMGKGIALAADRGLPNLLAGLDGALAKLPQVVEVAAAAQSVQTQPQPVLTDAERELLAELARWDGQRTNRDQVREAAAKAGLKSRYDSGIIKAAGSLIAKEIKATRSEAGRRLFIAESLKQMFTADRPDDLRPIGKARVVAAMELLPKGADGEPEGTAVEEALKDQPDALKAFKGFECRKRASQAKTSLKALYVAEESFRGEFDRYSTDFAELGFDPTQFAPRYDFRVDEATSERFKVTATGKPGPDGMPGDVWTITDRNDLIRVSTGCGIGRYSPAVSRTPV